MHQLASSILSFFLSPFNWIMALIIAGYFLHKPLFKKICRIMALCIFLLFSNQWLLDRYAKNWQPVYSPDKLEEEWDKSTTLWINYIAGKTDEELSEETIFINFEDAVWAAILKDIALQLNYHCIHHRAQIQVIIRQQGIEPEFLDYIGTKVRKIS